MAVALLEARIALSPRERRFSPKPDVWFPENPISVLDEDITLGLNCILKPKASAALSSLGDDGNLIYGVVRRRVSCANAHVSVPEATHASHLALTVAYCASGDMKSGREARRSISALLTSPLERKNLRAGLTCRRHRRMSHTACTRHRCVASAGQWMMQRETAEA